MESRLYWSWGGYPECEEPGVRRGPAGTLECQADADNVGRLVVGPWQYQCGVQVCGWVGSTPPPAPPTRTARGEYPATRTRTRTTSAGEGATETCHMTVLDPSKEILGVLNARDIRGHARGCVTPGATLRL